MRWLLLVLLAGCGRAVEEPPPTPTPTPVAWELDGSWFVRYASDPKPYLDVAFREGQVPARVTATLAGPGVVHRDLELTWNAGEGEWQVVGTFLPDPLPGGWWWVSLVTAWDAAGHATTWASPAPWTAYDRGGEPGFFYAPEAGDRWRVETSGPAGGADPVVHVFRDDGTTWVAANDDWDVGKPWAGVSWPVQPASTYLVRVTGEKDDSGAYRIWAGPEGCTPDDALGAPDAGETAATAIELPACVLLRQELSGDVDWFRVVVP